MYRILLALVILVFLVRFIWIFYTGGGNVIWWRKILRTILTRFFTKLTLSDSNKNVFMKIQNFFGSVSLISFFILAITAILPVVVLNTHISGIFLIIHVTIAPIFVVALAMTALFWAQAHQFDKGDWIYIKALQNNNKENQPENHQHTLLLKIYFWIFLAFSVPASISMIFSMFPYFGTQGQDIMLNIHQYTTLVLLVIALLFTDLKIVALDKTRK